jgi:integration host factor subunit beta
MTKAELIEEVAGKVKGFTKRQTEIIINGILDGIKETLARGDKIEIRGFGSFRLRNRRTREAQPQDRRDRAVPAKRVPCPRPAGAGELVDRLMWACHLDDLCHYEFLCLQACQLVLHER